MSACDLCQLRGLEAGIPRKREPTEQTCFLNHAAGPGGCIHPEPDVHYRLIGLWHVFAIAQDSYTRDGMTGVWEKPTWDQIQSIAEGCDEPWDALTMERIAAWLSGFGDTLPKPKK